MSKGVSSSESIGASTRSNVLGNCDRDSTIDGSIGSTVDENISGGNAPIDIDKIELDFGVSGPQLDETSCDNPCTDNTEQHM